MTQAVPTSGFNLPGGAAVEGGAQNIPPQNLEPGFVNPAQQPNQTPPVAAAPAAAAPATSPLDASIAQLIAAIQAQNGAEPAPTPSTEVQPSTGKLNSLDVATIDDPILRSMATVMQTVGVGIDMDRALGIAIERGDVALIDKAYLREKGGANAEQLITIAEGIVQAVEAQSAAVTQEVHALAGGEQGWNAAVAAFNTAAPEALRKVVATMLDSEKKAQIKAGAQLVVEYAKSSGIVPQGKPLIQNGGAAVSAAQALSKEDFQTALRTLNPNDRQYQSLRQDLFARRAQGKQLGM